MPIVSKTSTGGLRRRVARQFLRVKCRVHGAIPAKNCERLAAGAHGRGMAQVCRARVSETCAAGDKVHVLRLVHSPVAWSYPVG